MQQYWYLLALIFSLGGLTYLDYRQKLAWFWNARVTLGTLGFSLVFFLAWDIVNIGKGVIKTNWPWVSGLYVGTPHLPIEEFLFLTLLGYQTLLLWRWRQTRRAR